jgi:flagellar biosynthesis/type III secretory pathway chaperone
MSKMLSTATTTLGFIPHNIYQNVPGFWIVPIVQEGSYIHYPAYYCQEAEQSCFGDLVLANNVMCCNAEKMTELIANTVKSEYGTIWLVLDPRKCETTSCKLQQAAIVAIKLDKYGKVNIPTIIRSWDYVVLPENGTERSRVFYDETTMKGKFYWSLRDAIDAARAIADDIATIIKQHCKKLEDIEQTKLDSAKGTFDRLNAFLGQREAERQKEAEEAAKEAEKAAQLDAEWNELSTKDKAAALKQHKASLLTQPTTKRGRPPKTDKKVQPLRVTLKRGRHPKK